MFALKPIEWIGSAEVGHLRLLDQRRLPADEVYLQCRNAESVRTAIQQLSVRGAPAIGIAAAYGCVLGARAGQLAAAAVRLAGSRPTAVNLAWAVDRMLALSRKEACVLLDEARKIHAEDAAMCRQIGEHALRFIEQLKAGARGVLTHCNAGALATGGMGTATAPMYLAQERGLPFCVFADETRPLLQGSRLTAFELAQSGIDVTLICDDMAAAVMGEGRIGMVITGADRIAANGDTANKIGTYALAIMARHHGIAFYVAAPSTTFDLSLAAGDKIPIEQRSDLEITEGFGPRTAPVGVKAYCPAFDVTPHHLISAIVTERGVIEPVNAEQVVAVMGQKRIERRA